MTLGRHPLHHPAPSPITARTLSRQFTVCGFLFIDSPPWDTILPDQRPLNEAEIEAAAKKYGMRPEHYKAFDDPYHGDYPDVPYRPMTDRDLYYPWDYPETQRDFGDFVSVLVSVYSMP